MFDRKMITSQHIVINQQQHPNQKGLSRSLSCSFNPAIPRFLYKWRFPLAITGLCLFAVMTAGAATPVAAPMAAAAAVPAAAPTITAGTTAMAVVSWAMALVQACYFREAKGEMER